MLDRQDDLLSTRQGSKNASDYKLRIIVRRVDSTITVDSTSLGYTFAAKQFGRERMSSQALAKI